MKKCVAIGVGSLFALIPVCALADSQGDALAALYAQLVPLLKEELTMIQPTPSLAISPTSGQAPLAVVMTIASSTLTEAIDFGDGHSTGSNGCGRNTVGFCDLSKPISHTYSYPGTYKVTLYKHIGLDPVIVNTQTVLVSK